MKTGVNIDNLKELFKQHGFRYTMQRQAVMDIILEHPALHMKGEEIHKLLRQRYPEIGLSTVYRTLLLLEKMRLIRRTDLGDGCARYEACGNSGHAHHHLICSRCGAVMDMEEDLLDELEKQILKKNRFKVENHSVKFFGCCEKCM